MTKGPRRLVLDHYLDSAAEGVVKNAGHDWKRKADDLHELGTALREQATQAELRIGEQTLTGPALRAGMEESSASLIVKSDLLRAAGEALALVGQQLADTRETRDALADIGPKPPAYQAPAGTPGVEPTKEELQAQADASQARQTERTSWQSHYDKQEARSLALTKEMDAAFLGAIGPMQEIHGEQDPTEPPPGVPSGPGGTYLPGTSAPPPTGGGGSDRPGRGQTAVLIGGPADEGNQVRPPHHDIAQPPTEHPPTTHHPTTTTTTTPTTHHTTTPPTYGQGEAPSSSVTGSSQSGVSYQPGSSSASVPGGAGGSAGGAAGASSAALGAAGGAGGLAAGAVRPGAPSGSTSGSSPVRPIGSSGRAGSPGALSRSAGSTAGRAPSSTGSPSSRSAGSSTGRGSAGGRGGSSGGRGSNGARSGGSGAGGRGGRRGERESTDDRDSLVYDQDWLGDDDVAPGVLD